MFPSIESADRRFASLHWVLQGEFPSFVGTIKTLRLPAIYAAALRFLRLAVPRFHSLFRSRADEWAARAWSWLPGSPAGELPRRGQDLPSSWGTNCPFAHVPIRRRQDCLHQTIAVQQRGPWSSKGKGSHDWVFRRSIAWLSDSLSTLRNADYSNTTQDSLPVAGQALLDGLSTRKVPMKGFKVVVYISFPLPKLAWRNRCDRCAFCRPRICPAWLWMIISVPFAHGLQISGRPRRRADRQNCREPTSSPCHATFATYSCRRLGFA